MNRKFSDVTHFLQEANHVLITAHLHPDGDAISSTLATAAICRALGIPYTMVNDSVVPERFYFLSRASDVLVPNQINRKFNYVIALDCADEHRMGDVRELFADDAKICNIDHHATNDLYGEINMVVPYASSTVEIIYDWVEELGIPWDKELATYVYTGLLTDTGGFRYSNTTSKVLKQAANLVDLNIDHHLIADRMLETISVRELQILQVALTTLQVSPNGKIAWMTLQKKDFERFEATSDDIGSIVNYARNIEGVDVGILFRAESDHIKVSLRSREIVDVGEVAKLFGGGGHARAAGCAMNGEIFDVEKEVLNVIENRLGGQIA